MQRYDLLLLDADDTLYDFNVAEANALASTFQFFGVPYNQRIKERYIRINRQLWADFEKERITQAELKITRFAMLFEGIQTQLDFQEVSERFSRELGECSDLLDKAYEVCRDLSKTCKLVIVTNGVSYTQHRRINRSSIRPFISQVFVSEDVGCQKPQLAFFEYVYNALGGFDKSKTLIVGDSLSSDIKGGNGFGIDTCWFNPLHRKCPDDIQPTMEIAQLDELFQIINCDVVGRK